MTDILFMMLKRLFWKYTQMYEDAKKYIIILFIIDIYLRPFFHASVSWMAVSHKQ